jgi:hypothetical protein
VQLSVSRTMATKKFLSRISGKTNIFRTVKVICFYVINIIQNFKSLNENVDTLKKVNSKISFSFHTRVHSLISTRSLVAHLCTR